MKTLKILFLFSLLSSFLYAEINKDIHFSFPIYKFSSEHKNKIKSVAVRVSKQIEKDLNKKSYISFSNSEKQDIKDFSEHKKINTLITYTFTYLKNKDFFKANTKEIITLVKDNSFTQYYLIANKNSNINSINDLQNKSFVTYKGSNNYTLWLDYLTLSKLNKPYKKIIQSETNIDKDKTLILDVFFKKSDFSVIPKYVYEDMVLLNPSLKNELKIIEKSEPIFMYALMFVHKLSSKEVVENVNEALLGKGSKKRFNKILNLIDRNSLKKIEFKDLEPLEKLYDEYIKLKNKTSQTY